MSIYTLYIKTHNKTGYKYLGQTTQDPFEYLGSGYDWTDHLEVYGFDIHTTILFQTAEREELKQYGKYYSNLFKVTSSVDDYGNRIWANRIPEVGGGGGVGAGGKWSHTEETRKKMSKPRKEEFRETMRIVGKNRPPQSEETRRKNSEANKGENNGMYGKTPSQVCCLTCKRVHGVANHLRAHGAKCGTKIKVKKPKNSAPLVSCLCCRKVTTVSNHARHHGAKCKT